jgi:hypothetical protein
MEATFVVDLEKDQEFVKRFAQFFAGKKIKITVEEVSGETARPNGKELLGKLQEIQQRTTAVPVSFKGDINDLIDEMNNTKLD